MEDSIITFTVVGYNYTHEWNLFISSLLLQHDDRWVCQLWNDGPDPIAEEICGYYVDAYPDKFSYHTTSIRHNDWGHTMRDLGLKMTKTKYWSTQNADNYLTPKFVEYILNAFNYVRDLVDMVIFPCVHNYPNVNPPSSPPYSVLDVAPRATRCDAGSLVIRTELAQKVGWNHRFNEADGAFIDDVMRTTPRPNVLTLPNILMVHN